MVTFTRVNILENSSGELIPVEIVPINSDDYKSITKERYFFNWKTEKEFDVYKLIIKGGNDIVGLVSFEIIPAEWRIHIRLLTVSVENKGANKKYDRIAGNLIAYVSKIAVKEFAELACVSLVPKTSIAKHYMEKYRMNLTGRTLSLEIPEILSLINQYDND